MKRVVRLGFTIFDIAGAVCLVYLSWRETHGTYTTLVLGIAMLRFWAEDYAKRKIVWAK
jgi:hypothetical protein